MNHVTHRRMVRVGRLGALVIALGIGCGAAAAIPTAWADSTEGSAAGRAGRGADHSSPAHPSRQAGRAGVPRASATLPTSRAIAPKPTSTAAVTPVAAVQQASTLSIRGNGQPPVRIRRGQTAATELSGIAYNGGNTYYAVGDDGAAKIWQLDSPLGRTGWIRSLAVAGGINAPMMGRDSEGIALSPERTRAWVSDEIDSTINQFSLLTGLMVGSVTVPSIYRPANVQGNFGLESLSYGAGKLWTGNEEALKSDGPLSTASAGSWVRIQSFSGPDLTPDSQHAYRTDPIAAMSPFTSAERSGLVDVLALPDGQVLTLERELGGFIPLYRTRVYLLDFAGATDVTDVPSLSAGDFTGAGKKLLWQGWFTSTNFEGITLGPALSSGAYPLVLVSDDGQGQLGQLQTLFSLKLSGLTTPASASSAPALV